MGEIRRSTLTATVVALVLLLAATVTEAADEEAYWFWFQRCGHDAVSVEVRLDAKRLLRRVAPICHAARTAASTARENQTLKVRFRPSRQIAWEGYRSDHDLSPKGHLFETDIWEAGADPDALLLGVSVLDEDDKVIYMNTVIVVNPESSIESEIGNGMIVAVTGIK